ncbi:MAG: signal peptidase I [Verrucomicrobiota bacterium]
MVDFPSLPGLAPTISPELSTLAVRPIRRETRAMVTPKWKKEALHLVKGARKFVDYKRDLLKPERVAEIDSRRVDLLAAIKSKDQAKVNEASKQIRAVCENSLPKEPALGWFEENVEVMFVAIVIALGLRAYYLQPFRIPTGSMQPTLNGIIGTSLKREQWPSFPVRMWEKAVRGRTYVYVVNDKDRHIALTRKGGLDIRDTQYMHFFSRSEVRFSDAPPLQLPAPSNPSMEIGLSNVINHAVRNNGLIPKGMVICEGTIDSGDLVLVDKFSYHFRKPVRGEVFVFNTIDIEGIQKRSGEQGAGSHYIKRLCGVPGDTISIQSPNLLIDGKIAREPGIQRVIMGKGDYHINPNGYGYASANEAPHNGKKMPQYLAKEGATLSLAGKAAPGMREYAALGDNTGNSLDSRYWGPVKEFNLVGPALFSLWPITTGHWGFIR